MSHEEEDYHPIDAITPSIRALGVSSTAGFVIASVQATLTRRNIGSLGVLTQHGATVATFAAVGTTFEFTRLAAANLRQRKDTYNDAIGGFLSGTIVGIRRGTIPSVLACGAGLAILTSAFSYTGGSLSGSGNAAEDKYEQKMALRANRRRPIEETISELGEGRGIYAPGYAERRQERIKERYGIDVPS